VPFGPKKVESIEWNPFCRGTVRILTALTGTVKILTVPVKYRFPPPLSRPLSCPQVHSKNQQKSERYIINISGK
jgi:hypothetical protein